MLFGGGDCVMIVYQYAKLTQFGKDFCREMRNEIESTHTYIYQNETNWCFDLVVENKYYEWLAYKFKSFHIIK